MFTMLRIPVSRIHIYLLFREFFRIGGDVINFRLIFLFYVRASFSEIDKPVGTFSNYHNIIYIYVCRTVTHGRRSPVSTTLDYFFIYNRRRSTVDPHFSLLDLKNKTIAAKATMIVYKYLKKIYECNTITTTTKTTKNRSSQMNNGFLYRNLLFFNNKVNNVIFHRRNVRL